MLLPGDFRYCTVRWVPHNSQMFINRFKNYSSIALAAGAGASGSGLILLLGRSVLAEEKVDPPKYPWSHSGLADSYDHARYNNIYLCLDI